LIRSGGEVARLLGRLRDDDPIRRDAAIARLRIIGTRATDALTVLALGRHPLDTRSAALKALEGVDDPRAIEAALQLITDAAPGVAIAAIGVLRHWVTHEAGTRVLDALTSAALDPARDSAVRLAALDAVAQLPRHLVAPLVEQAALSAPVAPGPDDALVALDWLSANRQAPLSRIHELLVRIREREREERSPARREQWTRARGAAHAVLAARRSTIAVYDLRETFDAATTPLPTDFLTAVGAVGDASCLEPMARAWAAAPRAMVAYAAGGSRRRHHAAGETDGQECVGEENPSQVAWVSLAPNAQRPNSQKTRHLR
jgi:hypothetical protein